jgi:hypothetical protein
MGCDIHAMIERKSRYGWVNSGDPDVGRNYEMFAVLAGVRNYDGITPIAEPRGLPSFKAFKTYSDGEQYIEWADYNEKPCYEMEAMAERYGVDGHSHSWLTLVEIKAFDTTQTVHDGALVVGRDEAGAVKMTARWSSGPTEGPVGERRILTWPGEDEPTSWLHLIKCMEQAKFEDQSDEEIRLVFFFDN